MIVIPGHAAGVSPESITPDLAGSAPRADTNDRDYGFRLAASRRPGMTATAAPPHRHGFLGLGNTVRRFAHFRQNLLDFLGDEEIDAQRRRHEFHVPHMVDQDKQRVPIAVDVGDQDRLLVTAELRPGELFDQFLERAEAPGKATKPSARSNIVRLRSCMSAVTMSSCGSLRGRSRLVRNSGMIGDLAAVIEHGVRERAHDADGAAAINQPHVFSARILPNATADAVNAGRSPGSIRNRRKAREFRSCVSPIAA